MRCEEAMAWLERAPGGRKSAQRSAALEHVAKCSSCGDARRALEVLSAERWRRVPAPPGGGLQRAVRAAAEAATLRSAPRRRPRAGFWVGLGVGASLAAALGAVWILVGSPEPVGGPVEATPEITMALNETRNVNISVDTPMALADAEIHVVLTGEIGLAGFGAQRELRWHTDLAAGVNQLTLPVVALGEHGGQLLVEVQHGDKRRSFLVDVRAGAPAA
ncbi:MAG TPA: hypothetical protein VFY39_13355 [Gammaproteobacteria bacterium]|nr:hypothetical protein [Gammaproteobacteria bacterium]